MRILPGPVLERKLQPRGRKQPKVQKKTDESEKHLVEKQLCEEADLV